ncbi:hypothetical protein FKP32DRAFT_1576142, partial [Trametes sanguinea]
GCGATVAYGLVRYGLGRALHAALTSLSESDVQVFLLDWRAQLRDNLRNDPHGIIGRRQPALAASVPANFPDVAVARLFLTPALLPAERYTSLSSPRPIDLPSLGRLCERYFSWGSRAEILKTFRTTLWVGEALGMLISESRRAIGGTVEVCHPYDTVTSYVANKSLGTPIA